jgi:dienelactone hydrolase
VITARGRARRAAGALCAVLLVATGLAFSGSVAPGHDAGAAVRPIPEQFTGSVADFYRVPTPLRREPRGTLIRIQEIGTSAGATTVRVMYHSRDAQNRDRAVTGVITYPTTAPPKGGWPVVAWAHGTTGLSSACAPSRGGAPAPAFGLTAVRVATDYIGLGPVGERHPYLSGVSEAHSVVDAVRAARRLPGANASTRWVAVGHSQGGHAALFTNELGARYARGLRLRGTVAIAPAAVLGRTFGAADQIVPRMVGIMALYGWAADYPQVDPHDYVGADVQARESVIDTGCLDDIVEAFVTIPAETFYRADPLTTEPARSVVLANDPGHVAVKSPLMVVYGTADTFVVPARVHALVDTLCAAGQATELVEVPGADHGTVPGLASATIAQWLTARFANNKPPPNSCAAPSAATAR